MSRAQNYWWGAALLAGIVVGGMLARSTRAAFSLIHPGRTPVSAEAKNRAFATIVGLEDIALRTADGLTLRGWFSPGTRRAVVIFVHGLGGNRASLFPEARLLSRQGYGILLYDSRASGESDGDTATWGDKEQLDVRAAVDYVSARPDVDPNRIAALGFSVGGSTVAMAAASDPRIHAVILYATWLSLEQEMKTNQARYGALSWGTALLVLRHAGARLDHVSPIDHVALIAPRPLLMLAGGKDTDTPLPIMEQVFAAAGEPKELVVFPESNHGGYLPSDPELYKARVTAFLDRSLF